MAADADLHAEMERTVEGLQVFFAKWSVEVVVALGAAGTQRFNALKERLGGISSRTLAQRLRELEAQGIVARAVFDEMPVRVEYSLTEKGTNVATLALPLVLYLRVAGEE